MHTHQGETDREKEREREKKLGQQFQTEGESAAQDIFPNTTTASQQELAEEESLQSKSTNPFEYLAVSHSQPHYKLPLAQTWLLPVDLSSHRARDLLELIFELPAS